MKPGAPSGRAARLALALAAALAASAARAVAPAQASLDWSEVRAFRAVGPVTAVAADGAGRVAVGTDRGVWLAANGGAARRVLGAPAVHDLAFADGDRLFVASDRGVDRVDADGTVSRGIPGPGDARHVQRLLVTPEGLLAAAGSGLFFSAEGMTWHRVDGALPRGAVVAIALDPSARGSALFVVLDGALYRCRLRAGGGGPTVVAAERLALPESEGEVVDLAAAPRAGAVYALGPRSVSRISHGEVHARRLVLPPGARAQRLAAGHGRLWIATDRGLVEVPGMQGVVSRVEGPPAGAPVAALALSGGTVLAGGARGLWAGRSEPPAMRATAPAPEPQQREPGIVAVQQAALRYVDLGPEHMRALSRGVARRGWLPTVQVSGGWGDDRSWGWAADETFTYGSLHHLQGSDWGRKRSFDVGASLKWDLGDIAYNSDSVDVSKETRALIELRDEVLDQVDQLYFERRRILLELAAVPEPQGAKARRLRIRAEELGAGLDAWTGGWWSARLATSRIASPRGPDPRTTP